MIFTTPLTVCAAAATTGGGDEHNLDLSLGSSAGSKRGSLDGSGAGDDETSDQRVPMAFDLDWQTAAARSTKAKVCILCLSVI
jgi:AP2-like factor (euAP2 lineage)